MKGPFQVTIPQEHIDSLLMAEIKQQIDYSKIGTLWDMKRLMQEASMSRGTLEEYFLHDERFENIKMKIGTKFYWPADQAKELLLIIAKERSKI